MTRLLLSFCLTAVIAVFAVVAALLEEMLRGTFSDNEEAVAESGLWASRNLADNNIDNGTRLGAAAACNSE